MALKSSRRCDVRRKWQLSSSLAVCLFSRLEAAEAWRFGRELIRGCSHARALGAVGDRLLYVACAMLKNGKAFDPCFEAQKCA